MLDIRERAEAGDPASERLVLPYERRQKSRLRATLESGVEAAIELERGTALRGGDKLKATNGTVVEVEAAPESVSVVSTHRSIDLVRAAYHLGNRHIPLQIREGELSYLHDHVLDTMVRSLGLEVQHGLAPFEPESGAYGSGHAHAHGGPHHSH
jgi:urease accessory protein